MNDVLNDALSNLEHDNYERSYAGAENRLADVALIRAALAAHPAASAEYSQFLTDVMTAAGLVSHGKQCKALGERLGAGAMKYRLQAPAASVEPVAYAAVADNGNIRIWSREPLNVPGCVPLYTAPPAAKAEADDARDAARYRWLRDHGFQHAVVCLGTDFDGDNFVSYRIDFNLPEPAHMKFEDDEWGAADVDAAIDAAMQRTTPQEGRQ